MVIPPARDFGDACRLLSVAEVQAAIGGGPVTAASQKDPQAGSFCMYAQPSRGSGPVLTVQVAVQATASIARDGVDQLGGSPLSGIGDRARLSTPNGLATVIDLARGPTSVTLSTMETLPDQALVQLATLLAGRL